MCYVPHLPGLGTSWLEGSLPGGASVRFIHFDPDDSHGDIYFDVE